MTTISLKSAKSIAADWHSGQWSALYSLASTGIINGDDIGKYIAEIDESRIDENITKIQLGQLNKLKRFFITRLPR